MTVQFIGTTFPQSSQWHRDEVKLCNDIKQQIDNRWPAEKNLLINTTWFGPQFYNDQWQKFESIVAQNQFDQFFLLSSVDPVSLTTDQIKDIASRTGARNVFLLGNFDTSYQFSFIATLLPKYFKTYTPQQLMLQDLRYLYINYNRKPRAHRVDLVLALQQAHLLQHGIVTLGNNDRMYSQREKAPSMLLNEHPNDFAGVANWGFSMQFGIPHDIHSLGNMSLWQSHFLTVVSETEFLPWDPMFVTEKTWKPILGMRPFVINGQIKIYEWLRNNGFATFNHYFPSIDLENAAEYEIHDSIVAVIKYLATLSKKDIEAMYRDMLPSLTHNRDRFFEFAEGQKHKIDHLFA